MMVCMEKLKIFNANMMKLFRFLCLCYDYQKFCDAFETDGHLDLKWNTLHFCLHIG